MGVDLRTPKINFAHLMEKIQPMAVSQFVVWLDEKISEFKVLGSMDLDERMDAPKWIKDYSMSVMVSGISAHGPPEESQSAPKRQRVSMESPKPSHNFRQELDRQARVRTMEPPPVRKRNIVEMPESRAPREEDTSDLDFVDIKKEMLDEDDDISVIGASIPLASGPRDLGSPASRSSRSFSSSSSPTSIHPASINTKGTIDMPTRSPKRSHSSESSVIPVSLIQNTSFSQSPSSSSRVPLLSLTPEISSLVQSATDDNSVSLSMAHSPSNLQLAIPSASKSEPDDDDDLQMSMESYGDSADNLPEDWQQYAQLQDSSMMEGEDPGPSGSQQYTGNTTYGNVLLDKSSWFHQAPVRQSYSAEFKMEVIQFAEENSNRLARLRYNVLHCVVCNWRKKKDAITKQAEADRWLQKKKDEGLLIHEGASYCIVEASP